MSIDKSLPVIPVSRFEAVASMTVRDLLETAVPARAFLPNARLNPIEQREVSRLRDLHQLVQRDFAGEKKRNAQGPLADYIGSQWLEETGQSGPPKGFLPAFELFFLDELQIDSEDGGVATAHITSRGIFLDGESRGEALLVNVERLPDREVDQLLRRRVAVHIIHGVRDPAIAAKYFADVNGRGVGVNPNLVVMADFTDPFASMTRRIFESLGLELETRQRQVGSRSSAIMTGLQARLMVAAVAKGVGVVSYGAKAIPADGIDLERLEAVAKDWLDRVFTRFGPDAFRDRSRILRAVPVLTSLGALGRPFFDGDASGQRKALEVLSDKRIDWTVGLHWSGVCGKVNPQTGRFAVGGGKEYAHATYRALTETNSQGWRQIRHLTKDDAA